MSAPAEGFVIRPIHTPFPEGWQDGWGWPWRIGAGGTETPFLAGGEWWLYCWNAAEERHAYYRFATDTFHTDYRPDAPDCYGDAVALQTQD